MLYFDTYYSRLLESAVKLDTGKTKTEFLEMVTKITEETINDEIKQSLTQRCTWFINKLFTDAKEIVDLKSDCNIEVSENDNKLTLKVDGKELEGVTKALATVLYVIDGLANSTCDRKSISDKIITQSDKVLYKEFLEELASKNYPVKVDEIKRIKCNSSPFAGIIKSIAGMILLSEKFDKYEMSLLLLLTRTLRNPKTCMKYLITVLSKVKTDINKDVLISDLKNYL